MRRVVQRLFLVFGTLFLLLAWAGVSPADAQGGGIYIVRPGDTMINIAARYGLTATQLAAANGLRWNAWVYVGQRLQIPGQGSAPSAPATGSTYIVRQGDSLSRIATRHGISVAQLAAANGLRTNAWVYVGQRLQIPVQGSPQPVPTAPPAPAPAPAEGTYIVRPGDTLISIAARHRVTVAQLAEANGLYTSSWVYTGQRLKIPGAPSDPGTPPPSTPSPTGSTYIVRPGDTLIGIASRHGISVSRLAAANGLHVTAWVYVGQKLQIPGGSNPTPPSNPPSNPNPPSAPADASGKWIDVDITAQTVTAFEGQTPVFSARVSTGIWRYPTVVGTFHVYVKYAATRMVGPGYNLPNVPWTMYFYKGYALHGTYWHNNFGTPMSHGCVNLSIPDAKKFYDWAPVGTKVVTHY